MTASHVVTGIVGLFFAYDSLTLESGTRPPVKDIIYRIVGFAIPTLSVFGGGLLANRMLPPATILRTVGGVGIQLATGLALVFANVFVLNMAGIRL